jgi:RNA recognition motif-containing protein
MDDHKLFVGNMAARITQRDLWRFFSPYGLIDECAKFHESYAFVRYVHADDAQRARRETHGAMLKGRKLKVEFAATVNKTNLSSWNQQSNYLFNLISELFLIRSFRIFVCSTTSSNYKYTTVLFTTYIITYHI